MAIYKVVNQPDNYRTAQDVENTISYITRSDKTTPDGIFGGAVPPSCAAEAMNCVTDAYHKQDGVRLRHSILSFAPGEVTVAQAKEIAQDCISYYSDCYQIIAGVHEDTDHPHIHIGMNTTSYVDGSKYSGGKKDLYGFAAHINRILRPYETRVRIEL